MSAALAKTDNIAPVADGTGGGAPLYPDEFQTIAAAMQQDAGIHLSPEKASLVQSRLSKRLRALGLKNYKDYCKLIQSPDGAAERKEMLLSLTTNVTHFFREDHHFKHLEEEILPPLLENAKKGGKVRIWSAGCSNGQEPYSIAMTILKSLPNAGNYDVKILATDIDTRMIQHGRQGTYNSNIMENVPQTMRERYFETATDGSATARQELKDMITFRPLNLNASSWPMKGKFQVVFCRNVVIYFNAETQKSVWTHFSRYLEDGAHLYIGHSERMSGPALANFSVAGITTYCFNPSAGKGA
jgi:chemotaxis protein methyltransferase CheR